MAYGALGGGTFLVQNKILPGSYINYVSVPRAANQFSDRGYCTIGLSLDWGPVGEVIIIEAADLQTKSLEILGYNYTDDKLKPIRDIMLGAKVLYLYRINDSGGAKATAVVADNLKVTAKYNGTVGNEIMITIENDVDVEGNFIVTTLLKGKVMDKQSVKDITGLKNNGIVTFSAGSANTLSANAGTFLANGTSGTVSGSSHFKYLELIEKYDFNTIGYAGDDVSIKALYKAFTVRLRDDEGVKFQCVLYNVDKAKANFEGLINIKNKAEGDDVGALVYWVLGQEAGCSVNKSITNKKYDGEYIVNTKYKTREAKQAIIDGFLFFYEKNSQVRVLEDINSFTEFTLYKNKDFSKNQVMRVLDQRAIDIAIIFNKMYLGKVQNNRDGRIAFWNELVNHANSLIKLGAIEDYEGERDTVVEKGIEKDSVVVQDYLTPVMAMQKLYQTIWVR